MKRHKGRIATYELEFFDYGFIALLVRQVYPATTTLRRNGGQSSVYLSRDRMVYAV